MKDNPRFMVLETHSPVQFCLRHRQGRCTFDTECPMSPLCLLLCFASIDLRFCDNCGSGKKGSIAEKEKHGEPTRESMREHRVRHLLFQIEKCMRSASSLN